MFFFFFFYIHPHEFTGLSNNSHWWFGRRRDFSGCSVVKIPSSKYRRYRFDLACCMTLPKKKRGRTCDKKMTLCVILAGFGIFFSGMQHCLRDPSSPSRDWTQGTAVKAQIFTTRNSLGGSFKAEPQDCLRHFLLRGERQGSMFCPPLNLGSVTAWPTEHGRSDTASFQAYLP